jgi:hypothetical protein
MVPAFNIHGYLIQKPVRVSPETVVVHGWDNEIIPVDHYVFTWTGGEDAIMGRRMRSKEGNPFEVG